MKESPILLNSKMVQAILDGEKTVTRRPVKGLDTDWQWCGWVISSTDKKLEGKANWWKFENAIKHIDNFYQKCPYGNVGDKLWVRGPAKVKGFFYDDNSLPPFITFQHSDGKTGIIRLPERFFKGGKPPRWVEKLQGVPNGCIKEMARIWLEITDVRVERVQDISEESAEDEGFRPDIFHDPYVGSTELFAETWESIYKNWSENPWVWVIEFKRIEK